MSSYEGLELYTIYNSPLDYPGKFVIRKFLVARSGSGPTDWVQIADSLAEIRKWVPYGLVRLVRDPSDEPSIVETWL